MRYVSQNTKAADPGAAQPHSGEDDGVRTSGAGGVDSGVGSSSGGDLDTDFIGVGTGGSGISQSGPDDSMGADETDGSSDQFASGPRAQGFHGEKDGKIEGTVIDRSGGLETTPDGQGADAISNSMARDDDSFAGEISGGEARGQDSGPGGQTGGEND